MTIRTESEARAAGFTQRIEWEAGEGFGGACLTKPEADLDGEFNAFCLEEGRMYLFHGWAISCTEEAAA